MQFLNALTATIPSTIEHEARIPAQRLQKINQTPHLLWRKPDLKARVPLEADRSMTGMEVAQTLDAANQERDCLSESITVDNGSEFCSRALEAWAMTNDVRLCFIRPGRPVENGFIESFYGRLMLLAVTTYRDRPQRSDEPLGTKLVELVRV